jgi:hypothetical protein
MQGLANQSNNFMSKKWNTKTIRMNHGRIVVVKLPNGDQWLMEYHDNGIAINPRYKDGKVINVERFSETAIVVKKK